MPDLSQMFPSKFLQAEDLTPGRNTIVTIDRVYPAQARARGVDDDPEVKWMIRFREYRKPMSLWKSTGILIGDVLGIKNSDLWPGHQIAIFPSTYNSYGEIKPCINVDKWKPADVAPKAAAGNSLVIASDKRMIGDVAAKRFGDAYKAAGKTFDDFLGFLRDETKDGLAMAFGLELHELPAGLLPAMKAFLDRIHTKPLGDGTAVNTVSGEVVDPTSIPGVSRGLPGAQKADVVPDEDIPF